MKRKNRKRMDIPSSAGARLKSGLGKRGFRKRRAFTLIEINFVIVIIGLLAAMAIPAFNKVRSNAREKTGLGLAEGVRHEVIRFYEYSGRFPVNNAECGLPDPKMIRGEYVSSVGIVNGTVRVTYTPADMETVLLVPVVNPEYPTGPVNWDLQHIDRERSVR